METPGATRSTVRFLLSQLEKVATSSSAKVEVPLVSEAPTAMTYGLKAGSRSGVKFPSLPAATTTTIPLFQACSTACESGSREEGWVELVPNERLRTRMLRPLSFLCRTTQSIAARTCETSTAPLYAPTWTLTIPRVWSESGEVAVIDGVQRRWPIGSLAGDDARHVGPVTVGVQVGHFR